MNKAQAELILFFKKNGFIPRYKDFTNIYGYARRGDWAKFDRGIDYGYGLVSLKFKEMMFFLSDKLNMWGNWGSTSTYMFYNPVYDIYVIGAFNQTNFVKKQVQFMIKIINIVSKLTEN